MVCNIHNTVNNVLIIKNHDEYKVVFFNGFGKSYGKFQKVIILDIMYIFRIPNNFDGRVIITSNELAQGYHLTGRIACKLE